MKYMKNTLLTVSTLLFMGNSLIFGLPKAELAKTLSMHKMSLEDRYAVPSVNDVMKDNILLALAYMRGIVSSNNPIDWNSVRKPFDYSFTLKPGETYAFQKDSLPLYKDSIVKTTDIHYAAQEGFKSDGYLYGDGVCHLASLFYWAAKDAGIEAVAPTNHNFAVIPEIPAEYGVAIYSMPGQAETNAQQNLYVKNDSGGNVKFEVKYDGVNLETKVTRTEPALSSLTQEVI